MPTDRQDMERVYVDYSEVHETTKKLFDKLRKSISSRHVVLIAVARGGWVTSRILAAAFEEEGVENFTYSINAGYQQHGTPSEYVAITQSLDKTSTDTIKLLITKGAPLIITDSVCQTGRELLAIRRYLHKIFPSAKIYIGAMNWVKYKQSPLTPWRSQQVKPDFYGSIINTDQMPYVEYPWEYSSLKQFDKLKVEK